MIELQTPKKRQIFETIDKNHEGLSHLCFWVQDIEAKYEELQKKSIEDFILHGEQVIFEVNGGKLLTRRLIPILVEMEGLLAMIR